MTRGIARLARAGRRDELTEEHRHALFAHTGDSMPLAPEVFAGACWLFDDARWTPLRPSLSA